MAKVIPIGSPVNDGERRTIAHLRDVLPDDYVILHNFEIKHDNQNFEVDIAVVAPHAVFLVDVKGTRGTIEVQGNKWYPEGRRPFFSPLPKIREHAKSLKGVITKANPANRDLERVFIAEAVILCAPDAYLVDPADRDAEHVCTIKKAARFFTDTALLPNWANDNIRRFAGLIQKTITGNAKAVTGPLVFDRWEVTEKIGANDLYTEYRAVNSL
ncbi:MAG: NERD domain-containing protein, partial [Bacteroidetes bacterium]|nr:NERD domain-containing protein [Bacteroidota bacterium]